MKEISEASGASAIAGGTWRMPNKKAAPFRGAAFELKFRIES
jgi:hypothetical protein